MKEEEEDGGTVIIRVEQQFEQNVFHLTVREKPSKRVREIEEREREQGRKSRAVER